MVNFQRIKIYARIKIIVGRQEKSKTAVVYTVQSTSGEILICTWKHQC